MVKSQMLDHERVESLFHAALEITPETERRAFIESRCAGNDLLREELLSLLEAHSAMSEAVVSYSRPGVPVPAAQFAKYHAVELIAQGGMSSVYRAQRTDGQFEQIVALKVLASYLNTPEFLARFDTERRLLAALNHPNITRLLDGGISSAGDPFLITEFVDGQRLDKYCDARKLTIHARVKLLLQVCDAVDFAHRNLIVHRDLKPANILIDCNGTVKLLDFGTASLIAATGDHTRTNMRMLTPRYASPEQIRGERAGIPADIFSLGVIAYELFSGSWPYGDPNSISTGLSRITGQIEPNPPHLKITQTAALTRSASIHQLRRILKGDLAAILFRALAAEPGRRYATVREFASDLERFASGRPVAAKGASAPYRIRRFVWRHRVSVVSGTLIGGLLLAAGAETTIEHEREQRRVAQLRQLNQSYLTDIYSEVSKLPGSTRARVLIVDRVRHNLDRLLGEAPQDSELRRALAISYVHLAEIEGEPFTISLGDSAAAMMSYTKAEHLAANGKLPADQAIVVRAREGIAAIQIRSGDYNAAAGTARRIGDIAERLWRDYPKSLEAAGQSAGVLYFRADLLLGHALMRAADVNRDVPGMRQALVQLEKAVAVAHEVQKGDDRLPDFAGRYSQYVGYAYEELGDFTGDKSYYRLALDAHRRAAESAEITYSRSPVPQNRRDYADTLTDYGWCQSLCGLHTESLQTLRQALAIIEPLSRADPNSHETQLDLATTYQRLGSAEFAAGQFNDALLSLAKARFLIHLPHPVTPADREIIVLLTRTDEAIGQIQIRLGHRELARQALAEAAGIVQTGSAVPPWRVAELRGQLAALQCPSAAKPSRAN